MSIDFAHGRLSFTESAFAARARRFATVVAKTLQNLNNRREVGRLVDLDATMLKDIGLAPGDVSAALAAPLSEDPSQYLARTAAGRSRYQKG